MIEFILRAIENTLGIKLGRHRTLALGFILGIFLRAYFESKARAKVEEEKAVLESRLLLAERQRETRTGLRDARRTVAALRSPEKRRRR